MNKNDLTYSKEKLNSETAQIEWKKLQVYFAAGQVIQVKDGQDLVQVGFDIAHNDFSEIEQLIKDNQIEYVSDEQALEWFETEAVVWALVIRPWILVQKTR